MRSFDIVDMKNKKVDTKNIEYPEQVMVNKYIEPDDVVLELGARYGSVSCQINKKLNNPRNHVAVEPDDRVWLALERNKLKNSCDFQIIKGFIGKPKIVYRNLMIYKKT